MKRIRIIPRLKFATIMISSLLMTACINKIKEEKISNEVQADIIKKCLKRIYQNDSKESYLVSPKYDEFEFNTFFKYNRVLEKYQKNYDYNHKKIKVLTSLNWTEKQFDEIKQIVNKNYLNQTNQLLLKLSNSKESHTVYFFSGIHQNLVFANVVDYCGSIKESNLNLSSFNKNQKFLSAGSIIFILKNGEVAEMIIDSDIALEYQCPD